MHGFNKYLEYQYRQSGDFYQALWLAIMRADTKNTARLAKGFPSEVEAYRVWSQEGAEAFAEQCSPDHPLLPRLKNEYAIKDENGKS